MTSLEPALRAMRGRKGPFAVLLCENDLLADASVAQLLERGFAEVLAIGPGASAVAADRARVHRVDEPILAPRERTKTLNRIVSALNGSWLLISFNGEFFYFPFAESRSVSDLIEFLWSERRRSIMGYTIDLYSENMLSGGVPDPDDAYFDAEGWYGFEREDGLADIYGGLGWRYEEYVPTALSRVNRPALFQAAKDVLVDDDLWLNDETLNSVACPWHNNPTVAMMSFRRARTLLSHPKFSGGVTSLKWRHSARFSGRSSQLVESGMIEAGQWM